MHAFRQCTKLRPLRRRRPLTAPIDSHSASSAPNDAPPNIVAVTVLGTGPTAGQ